MISNQIDKFLQINRTPDISVSVLWETLIAYIRGQIISYVSHDKREKKQRVISLSNRIAQLDTIYAISPTSDIYKEHRMAQSEFDTLVADQTVELLLKTNSVYFEQGDKAGKLLAHQLRQTASSHQIPKIATSSGTTIDPKMINTEFKNYYASLYSSEINAGKEDLDRFFSQLEIPQVHRNTAKELENPVTTAELLTALKTMQSGKCPRPDGFPVEFHRCFQNKLVPVLIEMFNESFITGKLPPTLNQASISLILKKGKDPLCCSSYRPISLLNVDFKLLSKLLAVRLELELPNIISTDQTGFIKKGIHFLI